MGTYFIWVLVGAVVGFMVWFFTILPVPGRQLSKKVDSLRPLEGRSREMVIERLGRPTSTDRYGTSTDHGLLCTWKRYKYEICLVFNRYDTCTGISAPGEDFWGF